jgi:S-adenosylmethionine:tRNA ribosyltransferase-isomerase
MVVQRAIGEFEHTTFSRIDDYLKPGDLLVLNDTKVRPARLYGVKESGGRVEVLLLQSTPNGNFGTDTIWEGLLNCSKPPRCGSWLHFGADLRAQVIEPREQGVWRLRLSCPDDLEGTISRLGCTPLPPYIRRQAGVDSTQDRSFYQTVFARNLGSAAAPTAGLHFTEALLARIKAKGVSVIAVTLHVGLGTFQPVRTQDIRHHQMHPEHYEVTPENAVLLRQAFDRRQRIIAVGTTSTRVVETLYDNNAPLRGETNLFVYPGYEFKALTALVTNFHLPRSTLLMLVSAFAGRDLVLNAYREAVAQNYRFYSYGDAMLIL